MDEYASCDRCGRAAPPIVAPEFVEWEALDTGIGMVCPGCITWEELEEMAEDFAETSALLSACVRCRAVAPDDDDEWVPLAEGIVCPSCLTPAEVVRDIEDLSDGGYFHQP